MGLSRKAVRLRRKGIPGGGTIRFPLRTHNSLPISLIPLGRGTAKSTPPRGSDASMIAAWQRTSARHPGVQGKRPQVSKSPETPSQPMF